MRSAGCWALIAGAEFTAGAPGEDTSTALRWPTGGVRGGGGWRASPGRVDMGRIIAYGPRRRPAGASGRAGRARAWSMASTR